MLLRYAHSSDILIHDTAPPALDLWSVLDPEWPEKLNFLLNPIRASPRKYSRLLTFWFVGQKWNRRM